MATAKRFIKDANFRSYTSAFEDVPEAPSEYEIERIKKVMTDLKDEVDLIRTLHGKLTEFLPIRATTLQLMEEAIEFLKGQHLRVNVAKVTGSSVSLVGSGVVLAGVIAAPFTLGISLIISGVGAGICAGGGLTSAGAGIAEFVSSKKKVAEIQKAVEKDVKCCQEIHSLWQKIMSKCKIVAEAHSTSGPEISAEEVFSVLMVCCMNILPDKVIPKSLVTRREKVCSNPSQKHRVDCVEETAGHVLDGGTTLSGVKSMAQGGRAAAGVAISAIVAKTAVRGGGTALMHCAKIGGISRKVVMAANVFRVATGVSLALSVPLLAVGGIIDVASLIYSSYHIHKKSDSSAGKELKRKKEELEESRDRLKELKDCLENLLNDADN